MPAEDHLEGRDVDAEFAAIVAGWELDSVDDLEDADGTNADTRLVVDESSDRGPGHVDTQQRAGDTPTSTDHQGSDGRADDSPDDSPTDPELPTMPGFPGIVTAIPVPPRRTPRPPEPPREIPPPSAIELSLDEHFEPEPVQLPPQEDLHFWGIVGGLVLGPLLLLWALIFGEGHSWWWPWIGAALTIGGFVLLVLRQPRDRDEDDDGARV